MDAEARTLSRTTSSNVDEELKTIAIFCGIGLLLSLLAVMSFGMDLGNVLF
ncbi:hypothetical protein [Bradyrhizobium sp. 187]|uniref:hypothetical protein n=1 Tax=Bradyrhizobium sp. 187 TaxID=2782655 RepID=UPI001FFEB76C|nr:hypothetical protein [Bradyrhizobium sp. 187]UPJ71937.1 hypothetical protein IVB19_30855 [Bradyrhizobium sp. 187]